MNNEQRDKKILELLESGESYGAIGRLVGLTRQRVCQIAQGFGILSTFKHPDIRVKKISYCKRCKKKIIEMYQPSSPAAIFCSKECKSPVKYSSNFCYRCGNYFKDVSQLRKCGTRHFTDGTKAQIRSCVGCISANAKKYGSYYNKEVQTRATKKWATKNREKVLAYQRRYYKNLSPMRKEQLKVDARKRWLKRKNAK